MVHLGLGMFKAGLGITLYRGEIAQSAAEACPGDCISYTHTPHHPSLIIAVVAGENSCLNSSCPFVEKGQEALDVQVVK